jgi:hypothetical protein
MTKRKIQFKEYGSVLKNIFHRQDHKMSGRSVERALTTHHPISLHKINAEISIFFESVQFWFFKRNITKKLYIILVIF